ncbi:MAG TPA: glycosyltransferase family 9 protein [Longimicrobiales bacterium]|nr:glycosyltransferase family 9 protein [Longimicrobiales bacterium]
MMESIEREPPRHICVVLLTGLGDVVHGLPVVNALRRAWPDTNVTWVVEPMPAGILQPHPSLDQVIVYEKKRGVAGVRDLRRRMARERFDLAINFNIYFKSIFPTLFSRAPERWTFGRDRARDGVWLAGNRHLPARPRRHTQDMFLEFVEVLGVDPYPLEWRLEITAAEREQQARFVDQLGGRRAVALVPASANVKKDWPAERYVDVVDAIEIDLGARAVLVGGPGDREVEAARIIEAEASQQPLWMMGDGVRRLIWILDACAAAVAPDTGPLHIARAVGTPVVGLFGHTNPWRVGPYRAFEDLWIDAYTEPGEGPDPSNFTPKLGRMETIEPRAVIEKVERALRSEHGAAAALDRPHAGRLDRMHGGEGDAR